MVQNIRRKHSDAFRAKVALEAAKGNRTIAEICSEYGVAATQVFAWKKQLLEGAASIFEGKVKGSLNSDEAITDPLLREIGRLQVENAFLKKSVCSERRCPTKADRKRSFYVELASTMRLAIAGSLGNLLQGC